MQRKMSRNIAMGALIGVFVGLALYLFFPEVIIINEVSYKAAMREGLGYPKDFYSLTGGSAYVAGFLIPLGSGILGGLVGWIFSLINLSRH